MKENSTQWMEVTGSSRSVWLCAVTLLFLAVIPYLNTLSNGFVLDDKVILVENLSLRSFNHLPDVLSSGYWGMVPSSNETQQLVDMYRPLTTVSFMFDYALWGERPFGFHLTNILLHALATVILFTFLLGLVRRVFPALAAACLFAVHPVHTEAVSNIVGRAEILATIFVLLALIVVQRTSLLDPKMARQWPTIILVSVCYFLGLLSKESAVMLPFVLLGFQILYRDRPGESLGQKLDIRHNIKLYLALIVTLAIYLAIRWAVIHSVSTEEIWTGFLGVAGWQRKLTGLRVLVEYLGLLFFPVTLSAEYWGHSMPIARTFWDPAVIIACCVLVAIGWGLVGAWKRRLPTVAFGGAWFFLVILPVSNLVITIGVGKAERLLYLPSVGLSIVIAGLLVLNRWKSVYWALICFCLLLATQTFVRNRDWKDNLTLAMATMKISPKSPMILNILGEHWVEIGQPEKGIPYFEEAIRQLPIKAGYYISLGNAYNAVAKYDQAEYALRKALARDPSNIDVTGNLAATLLYEGKISEAKNLLRRILKMNPDYLPAYVNLGAAYSFQNDWQGALEIFREGLKRFPNDKNLQQNSRIALEELGNKDNER